MKNFIIRIIAACIPNAQTRRAFRKQHMSPTIKEKLAGIDRRLANLQEIICELNTGPQTINTKLDYISNFLHRTTDITNIPAAHGNLRLLQQGSAKLLAVIDEICRRHNLKYWLMYGTLIGAIRHSGFIPWDDDIDIAMLRPDYEKLIQILGNGKLKKTTGNITFNVADICKVFYKDSPARVDIFPYEHYYKNIETEQDRIEIINKIAAARAQIVWDSEHLVEYFPDIIPTNAQTYKQLVEIQNKTVMEGKPGDTNCSLFRGAEVIGFSKIFLQPEMIFPLKSAQFAGYTVNIPNKAEQILEMTYGNIWEFPKDMSPHHDLLRLSSKRQMDSIKEFLGMDVNDIINNL